MIALTLFLCVPVGRVTHAQSTATASSVLTLAVLRNATDVIRPAQQVKPKLASGSQDSPK
jgi:hypothetical protein